MSLHIAVPRRIKLLLRIEAVKAETGERSNSSVYANIREGLFPKPVRIGKRSVGWPAEEVKVVCTARIAGKVENEIRELVRYLEDRRTREYSESINKLWSELEHTKPRRATQSLNSNRVGRAKPLLGEK
jgi:prophage regulatory protein